jgi:phosphocarrier protein
MVEIEHIITDKLGVHARPAGRLVRKAHEYESAIMVGTAEKMADAKNVVGVMTLNCKFGETLIMTFEGPDETEAAEGMAAFLKENL